MIISLYYNYLMGQRRWSDKQDNILANAVIKHRNQWNLIIKQTKSFRSKNSQIKRWHGKLKQKYQRQKKIKHIYTKQNKKQKNVFGNDKQDHSEIRKKSKESIDVEFSRRRKESLGSESDKQNQSSLSLSSISQCQSKHWGDRDYEMLCTLIVDDELLNWSKLAQKLKSTPKEVRKRWKLFLQKKNENQDKIGGSLKYSEDEDMIVVSGHKQGLETSRIKRFLLNRNQMSIDARWRRMPTSFKQIHTEKNPYYLQKQLLNKILHKRKMRKADMVQEEDECTEKYKIK